MHGTMEAITLDVRLPPNANASERVCCCGHLPSRSDNLPKHMHACAIVNTHTSWRCHYPSCTVSDVFADKALFINHWTQHFNRRAPKRPRARDLAVQPAPDPLAASVAPPCNSEHEQPPFHMDHHNSIPSRNVSPVAVVHDGDVSDVEADGEIVIESAPVEAQVDGSSDEGDASEEDDQDPISVHLDMMNDYQEPLAVVQHPQQQSQAPK